MLNILGVLLIIFFLILIHEFGHYIVAKRNGVKVHEFAIGFGPTFCRFKKYGTVFKLGILPLGGYVKLHGEDSFDPKLRKDKASFASKTPWQKTKIICAGVFMNFLVFWFLYSISLFVGTQPLILNYDDFKQQINNSSTILYHGSYVESAQEQELEGTKVLHNQTLTSFVDTSGPVQELETIASLDYELFPSLQLPVLKILDVGSQSSLSGSLKPGDIILKVNNKIVFSKEEFLNLLSSSSELNLQVLDSTGIQNLTLEVAKSHLYVSKVESESLAANAGVKAGWSLSSIEGVSTLKEVELAKQVVDSLAINGKKILKYTFLDLNNNLVELELSPSQAGTIGVYLSETFSVPNLDLNFVFQDSSFSLINSAKQQYSFLQAPWVALSRGYEVAKLSAAAISNTFVSIFTRLDVSEEVGGPIQVFNTGKEFVAVGGTALLNFIALISLTLAVVNILPIPALDGGRLLFIIIEAFRAKALNPKYESIIHALGFGLLLLMIFVISIFDIIRL